MANKAILFDLDGTLTDSGEGIINCAIPALEHFGITPPDKEKLRVFVGPPLQETFIKFGVPADKTDEAIAVYRQRYIPIGIFENKLYPGIVELLQTLVSRGHKLYVATSKPEFMTNQILDRFQLTQYFTGVCGASTDSTRNTKEAVIAHLLEQYGRQENMVMVGDTVYDVRGAAFHGIPSIGVGWGYGKIEDMKNEGAVAIAHSTQELLDILG